MVPINFSFFLAISFHVHTVPRYLPTYIHTYLLVRKDISRLENWMQRDQGPFLGFKQNIFAQKFGEKIAFLLELLLVFTKIWT
jgi:cytochrome b subunit of formate dehydrogenase